ncbi:S-methyl-5-thioribose-1-phosphate isomerase [Acetonema longum]|uniref:Methylthioribose-1-phosphate isomerase n=1 Tax=Acetonema longum DSM 6540 TaxID=1009370 RepID=F7NPB3_9FIRM|nr:aIF-2BI family translation initiation factor [Acetonema longum DSM 6540]
MQSIKWSNGRLTLLNQTLLPGIVDYIECGDYRRVAEAIRRLEVRGAPAIGAAAAFGLVLGARELAGQSLDFREALRQIADELRQTRPTAVNLFWAINRMLSAADKAPSTVSPVELLALLEQEALRIMEEDREVNGRIAQHGLVLFPHAVEAVLTHCNAGALATVDIGTALGVIRQGWQAGKFKRVFADETRPLLQGARLTAWELKEDGIPVTLITDSMAGWVMKQKKVAAVIVGADRIATNGDVANKIGTYSVAVLARQHGIPFYVAAPVSTFDFSIAGGDEIPIEERNPQEVTAIGGTLIAPDGIDVFNPAFDVTPAELVSAIITERGVLRPPYGPAIRSLRK